MNYLNELFKINYLNPYLMNYLNPYLNKLTINHYFDWIPQHVSLFISKCYIKISIESASIFSRGTCVWLLSLPSSVIEQ